MPARFAPHLLLCPACTLCPAPACPRSPPFGQALREVANHLRNERLHRRHVHNLELGLVNGAIWAAVQPQLVHDGEHRDVGLAGARGRADEHVLAREERGVAHRRLHAVERVHALERVLRPLGQLIDRTQLLAGRKRLGLGVRDVHDVVALV
eukprot:78657-Chlamydomonas_euryale.AAC.1